MSTDRLQCRCAKWDLPCTAAATQEDMRCDVCRSGCAILRLYPQGADPDTVQAGKVAPMTTSHCRFDVFDVT